MKTLIGLQDEYVATVNSAWARWQHRKGLPYMKGPGGHFPRVWSGARRRLRTELIQLGFTADQAQAALDDAEAIAQLERNAE